uniref:Uncharacterized protein n=1 Tax=Panagrolaimus davidi TaxID=227884 RepID=A0A914PHW0_9BILA
MEIWVDYYTSVDKTKPSIDYDYEGAETVNIEEEIINPKPFATTTSKTTNISTIPKKKEEPPLPELSFSVDETPEISSSIDINPDYGSGVAVDEKLPSSKNEIGLKKQLNALERRFVLSSTTTSSQPLTTTSPLSTIIATTFKTPTKHITTQKARKNFRRSDDYYSMYYDNN